MPVSLRLGVNLDHVATLRNARGGDHPDLLLAARIAVEAGADGITVHVREDRRHVRDDDARLIRRSLDVPLNLEMAVTDAMVGFAVELRPHAVCLVPERREELTTEGGLDVVAFSERVAKATKTLAAAGCRVSLFIDPDPEQVAAAASVGAAVVELHTGAFCEHPGDFGEFNRLVTCARQAAEAGLECHAGHGLDYATARRVASIPEVVELNIGHFLIGEAIFTGLKASIRKMVAAMALPAR